MELTRRGVRETRARRMRRMVTALWMSSLTSLDVGLVGDGPGPCGLWSEGLGHRGLNSGDQGRAHLLDEGTCRT